MPLLFWILGSTVASALLTKIAVHFAPKLGLMHYADSRSNHTQPIPTAGGLSFVIITTIAGCMTPFFPMIVLAWGLSIIGFLDDKHFVSIRTRLYIQVFVVTCALYQLSPLPLCGVIGILPFPSAVKNILQNVGLVFFGVWWTNALNFFDGTDGLSSTQSILMLSMALILTMFFAPLNPIVTIMVSLIGALLGFLWFNRPPAKIFMGNTSSAWLGYMIFCLALWTIKYCHISYGIWLILSAVPLTDTTWTLITRMIHRKPWTHPHRTHVYQKLEYRWCRLEGHRNLLKGLVTIYGIWIFPLTYLCISYPSFNLVWIGLVYLPLLYYAHHVRAGHENS